MIEIGRIYKLKIKVTKKRINLFKDLTLDKNIIHADSNAAKKIGLKKPLVYGMLTSSFLSNIIGNKLPGKGAIWTGCDISFSKPVFENDLLNFNSKILKISKSTKTLVIDTEVFNQNNDLVMNAVSSVKYPESFSKKINYKNKKKKLIKKVKLKDLNVVIGASSDLGLEFAKKIQNKNSKLLLTYFNGEKKIKKSLKKNKNTFLKKLDLNSKKDLFKVKKFISKKYTIKSLVFTVSGPIKLSSFDKVGYLDIKKEFYLQTIGLFNLIKLLSDDLKNDECSIVVIGSDVVYGKPPSKMIAYNIAKSSLLGLTKSLAVELGKRGIRVNMISPGIINANASLEFPTFSREQYKSNSTLNKIGNKKDISKIIEFLISKRSSHLTGVNLRANAGFSFD